MSLDSVTLQCFLALASSGSFTKAADRVGRTQSAVSQQISRLESLLGVRLIDRSKTVTLTTDGEIFQGYARKILDLQLEAIDNFKQPQLQGEVRFGLPEDFASLFLADVLVEFARIHPRILLKIECGLTLNLFERFKNHEFDIVLVKMSIPENFDYGQNIWSEKLEWVANKQVFEHLSRDQNPIPLVLAPQPCVYRSRALSALDSSGLKWQIIFSSPSYNGTVAAVKAGLGITVLPKNMIPNYLSVIKENWLPSLNDSHTSLLKHNNTNPAVSSLENFIIQKLKY
jgi:DNA-binding transcriptional LysR family regulator